jgi:hypothetical protein
MIHKSRMQGMMTASATLVARTRTNTKANLTFKEQADQREGEGEENGGSDSTPVVGIAWRDRDVPEDREGQSDRVVEDLPDDPFLPLLFLFRSLGTMMWVTGD